MEVVVLGNALERMCIMGTVMERQWTTCNNLQQVGAFSPRWIHQSRCTAMWCMAQGLCESASEHLCETSDCILSVAVSSEVQLRLLESQQYNLTKLRYRFMAGCLSNGERLYQTATIT